MRAVSHIFLTRSRGAIFWFLVTCASIGASGIYLEKVLADARYRPQYVMADSPELYYLSPDLEVETPADLHAAQTRLAMETIFNRTPTFPDNRDRMEKLFTPKALKQVVRGVIAPQAVTFSENKFHQKVELDETIVNIQEGEGSATTVATGQLIRTGVNGENVINEGWSVKVFFTWESNSNLEEHPLYPTICTSVNFFSMERIFP